VTDVTGQRRLHLGPGRVVLQAAEIAGSDLGVAEDPAVHAHDGHPRVGQPRGLPRERGHLVEAGPAVQQRPRLVVEQAAGGRQPRLQRRQRLPVRRRERKRAKQRGDT